MQYVQFLITFISGGLAGAVLNAFLTKRKQKTDMTLKVIDGFFDRYDDLASAKRLLNGRTFDDTPANRNHILRIGDWFETVAILSNKGIVDKVLLLDGLGFRTQIEDFRVRIASTDLFKSYLARDWRNLASLR